MVVSSVTPLISAATLVHFCGSCAEGAAHEGLEDAELLGVLLGGGGHLTGGLPLLALVHEHRGVATVVEDHVGAAAPPGQVRICSVQSQYSSRVSPFQAKTGTPCGSSGVPCGPTTTAAAASSWVE